MYEYASRQRKMEEGLPLASPIDRPCRTEHYLCFLGPSACMVTFYWDLSPDLSGWEAAQIASVKYNLTHWS